MQDSDFADTLSTSIVQKMSHIFSATRAKTLCLAQTSSKISAATCTGSTYTQGSTLLTPDLQCKLSYACCFNLDLTDALLILS